MISPTTRHRIDPGKKKKESWYRSGWDVAAPAHIPIYVDPKTLMFIEVGGGERSPWPWISRLLAGLDSTRRNARRGLLHGSVARFELHRWKPSSCPISRDSGFIVNYYYGSNFFLLGSLAHQKLSFIFYSFSKFNNNNNKDFSNIKWFLISTWFSICYTHYHILLSLWEGFFCRNFSFLMCIVYYYTLEIEKSSNVKTVRGNNNEIIFLFLFLCTAV